MNNNGSEIPYGFLTEYGVSLYFKQDPNFNEDQLKAMFEKSVGKAVVVARENNKIQFAFEEVEFSNEVDENTVIYTFEMVNHGVDEAEFQSYLAQTWQWEEASSMKEETQYQVKISDKCGQGIPYKERLAFFQLVLYGLVAYSNPICIAWKSSSQLVNPAVYLDNKPGIESYDLLLGALNVRLFTTEDEDGNLVMDTLGLAALGMVDVQCYFYGYDTDQVANQLYNYGDYLFWNGDVIRDGDTIEGLEADEKWGVRHELSLVEPRRPVLNVGPNVTFTINHKDSKAVCTQIMDGQINSLRI